MIPWNIRPRTQDLAIVKEVYIQNCYHVEDLHGFSVIDVGCNIGPFVALALDHGADRVVGYEADRQNAELAKRNIAQHPLNDKAAIVHAAIVGDHSDIKQVLMQDRYHYSNGVAMTGGKNIFSCSSGYHVDVLALSTVIQRAAPHASRLLIKLDCEGSEHNILHMPGESIGLVHTIVGECHRIAVGFDPSFSEERSIHTLTEDLKGAGFTVHAKPVGNSDDFYYFVAVRQ